MHVIFKNKISIINMFHRSESSENPLCDRCRRYIVTENWDVCNKCELDYCDKCSLTKCIACDGELNIEIEKIVGEGIEHLPKDHENLLLGKKLFLVVEKDSKKKTITKRVLDDNKTYMTTEAFVKYLNIYFNNNEIFRWLTVVFANTQKCKYKCLKYMFDMCVDLEFFDNTRTYEYMLNYDFTDENIYTIFNNEHYFKNIFSRCGEYILLEHCYLSQCFCSDELEKNKCDECDHLCEMCDIYRHKDCVHIEEGQYNRIEGGELCGIKTNTLQEYILPISEKIRNMPTIHIWCISKKINVNHVKNDFSYCFGMYHDNLYEMPPLEYMEIFRP